MKKKILMLMLFVFTLSSVALAIDVAKRDDYFEKGKKAYESGNYDRAIEYYEWVVDLDSNFAPVYNALGLAYSQTDSKLSDIIWFFKVAVDINSDYDEAYHNMCRVYSKRGYHDKAEDACLKAIAINPNLFSAKLSLAWIYLYGKNSPREAIYYFDEVLTKVKSPKIYFGRGMAYSMSGDRSQVLETVTLLRGMKENELAYKLEASIRDKYVPPSIDEISADKGTTAGTLVGSPVRSSSEGKPIPPSVSGGDMRIRLRGRLTNTMKRTGSAVSSSRGHPGSLGN